MIAMTTSSSMSVNAPSRFRIDSLPIFASFRLRSKFKVRSWMYKVRFPATVLLSEVFMPAGMAIPFVRPKSSPGEVAHQHQRGCRHDTRYDREQALKAFVHIVPGLRFFIGEFRRLGNSGVAGKARFRPGEFPGGLSGSARVEAVLRLSQSSA